MFCFTWTFWCDSAMVSLNSIRKEEIVKHLTLLKPLSKCCSFSNICPKMYYISWRQMCRFIKLKKEMLQICYSFLQLREMISSTCFSLLALIWLPQLSFLTKVASRYLTSKLVQWPEWKLTHGFIIWSCCCISCLLDAKFHRNGDVDWAGSAIWEWATRSAMIWNNFLKYNLV